MDTRKMRGYSLVMKPDGSGRGKTLKIYGVYEDEGGKACIQRVSDVDEKFKEQIRKILAGKGVVEKGVVAGPVPENVVAENVVERKGPYGQPPHGANIDSPPKQTNST